MADHPLACPACADPFLPDDVNVGTNVAFCRACSKAHVLSALAGAPTPSPVVVFADPEQERLSRLVAQVDTTRPPDGAWVRDDGIETVVGASMRSIGGAIALTFACLFWNGIVSVFVLVAIAGSLHHAGLSVPSWFPAPNMNSSGGSPMSLGMVLFLWVFLIPFLLVGSVLIASVFCMLAGRVEVTIRDNVGRVFTGIGSIGWSRRFDVSLVKAVDLAEKRWRDSDGDPAHKQQIVIDAGKPLRFGSMLTEERKVFVTAALRKVLVG